jgi:hypothetical protein
MITACTLFRLALGVGTDLPFYFHSQRTEIVAINKFK